MESITAFFRRANIRPWSGPWHGRVTTFVGKLDGEVVASCEPLIVFRYPHILHAAATVEDATNFLVKLNKGNTADQAALYMHDTDRWQRVNVPHQ